MSVIETISEAWRNRTAKKLQSFDELVRLVADGKEPSANKVMELLDSSGKTPADLETAVALLQKRRQLENAMKLGIEAEKERPEIHSAIKAAAEKLAEANRIFDETITPLEIREKQLDAAMRAGQQARNALVKTCDYPALQRQSNELADKLREKNARRKEVADSLRHGKGLTDGIRTALENRETTHGDDPSLRRQLEFASAGATGSAGELERIDAERDEITAALEEIRRQMLRP